MTQADKWCKRKVVKDYWKFKDALVLLAKSKRFKLGDSFRVEFFMKMPDSWSISKKAKLAGTPHQQRPDLDNMLKAIQDCLRTEDSGIWKIEASKIWWDEGKIIFYK